ncbi:MAG: PRC-barrel domain-containing protein [Candidatus Thermoplasmatota archaeon]
MEVTDFVNMPVYTNKGKYVGEVKEVLIDTEGCKIDKLIITDTNREIVPSGVDIGVPYRWVSAVGDIIILSYMPERVEMPERSEEIEEKK